MQTKIVYSIYELNRRESLKKITLVVLLLVMIATLCLVRAVGPDGLFSIEGTKWEAACEIRLSSSEPFINIECTCEEYLDFGFYLRGFKEG